jgi:uroporphyrin-III C-methyltransferase/precorrin-2 dehydrogenase/sirohydrochlorin ferrochelatase
MRGDMPVALVEKGTTPEHKVHTTSLAQLPDLVANETIHAPTPYL